MPELTQEHLKSILHYNPDTGLFIRLINLSNSTKVGDIIGSYSGNGYLHAQIGGKTYLLHRLAFFYMTGKFPENYVDHINGEKDDNKWVNLRKANNSENQMNSCKRKDNTSGYKGVTFRKKNNMWESVIMSNGKYIYLGYFNNPEEAHEAYKTASLKYHGEFSIYWTGEDVIK